jgi:hypothetical protein
LQAWVRGVPSLSFVSPKLGSDESCTLVCSDVADMASRVEQLLCSPAQWHSQGAHCKAQLRRHHAPEALLPKYRSIFSAQTALATHALAKLR